jgi:hypothetical protein
MVLVSGGKNSFYISEQPVSPEKVAATIQEDSDKDAAALSWYKARRYSLWLTEQESALYRLPTIEHMKTFLKNGGTVDLPVWTQSPDEPPSNEERKMRKRFGVGMVKVFDPKLVLGTEPVLGELPFAAYPQMRFHVVTPAETGWRFRWNTLKQTLDN